MNGATEKLPRVGMEKSLQTEISAKRKKESWRIIRLKLRSEKPQTTNELLLYIKAFFGLTVPNVQVCATHSTPADFIGDLYFERHSLILAIANRNGYKTLLVAIADVLDMWFKGAGIIHAGAIDAQAKKGYGYVRHFCEK